MRTEVLVSLGASKEVADELLRYNENRFDDVPIDPSSFPLSDESFVAAWRDYGRETDAAGSILPLRKYLVQLQFQIESGISETPDYIAATRRGMETDGMPQAVGLPFREPEQCRVIIHPTPAGSIPLLIAHNREDFVALVRALTHRNEPYPIPDSMGACMVAGYNNWNRISVLRERFEASASAHETWAEEFQRIKAQKGLYQDRFIILSTGPYSAVNASDLGLDPQEWRSLSGIIRREHECTHYFTRRVYSSMRNNLLDELIADYMGITAAAGRFWPDWLLRFFGLESFPLYREGGRLQNYRGNPPLSDTAFALQKKLIVAACANLEDFDRSHVPEFQHSRLQPALLKVLTRATVEELASREATQLLAEGFTATLRAMTRSGAANETGLDNTNPSG